MNQSEDKAQQRDVKSTRFYQVVGLVIVLIFFGVFGAWSAIAPLDEAVVAAGRVNVESNRKTVQHLEGGIVDEILVEEGERVVQGQPLLHLSKTQPEAQLGIVKLQHADAKILRERLVAELNNDIDLNLRNKFGETILHLL
jgi:multidrug efflux pump subunit AcrA (membrane-fusion protein)